MLFLFQIVYLQQLSSIHPAHRSIKLPCCNSSKLPSCSSAPALTSFDDLDHIVLYFNLNALHLLIIEHQIGNAVFHILLDYAA